jgi:hypothetical protein
MAIDIPLYQDSKIKIDLLRNYKNEIVSGEDHELWLNTNEIDWDRYSLGRGLLEELAHCHLEELEGKLMSINSDITPSMKEGEISLFDLEHGLKNAYFEEQRRYADYLLFEQRNK